MPRDRDQAPIHHTSPSGPARPTGCALGRLMKSSARLARVCVASTRTVRNQGTPCRSLMVCATLQVVQSGVSPDSLTLCHILRCRNAPAGAASAILQADGRSRREFEVRLLPVLRILRLHADVPFHGSAFAVSTE